MFIKEPSNLVYFGLLWFTLVYFGLELMSWNSKVCRHTLYNIHNMNNMHSTHDMDDIRFIHNMNNMCSTHDMDGIHLTYNLHNIVLILAPFKPEISATNSTPFHALTQVVKGRGPILFILIECGAGLFIALRL